MEQIPFQDFSSAKNSRWFKEQIPDELGRGTFGKSGDIEL